jgi:hypothetical protein
LRLAGPTRPGFQSCWITHAGSRNGIVCCGTRSGRSFLPDPRFLQASRLETIGYFLRERGFSADVIKKMSRPQRESTIASYDSKWSIFSDWCGKHEFSPVSPTLPQFLNFLNFLFSERKFSVQDGKGYRSVISTTLLLLGSWGSDWDFAISSLTRNMTLERLRPRHSSPKWDLSWGSPLSPWIR